MMSVECVAIFGVVNASNGEKSCLQFSIPTESGAGGNGGVRETCRVSPVGKVGINVLISRRYLVS